MLSILNKIRRTGILTESISAAEEEIVTLGKECQRHIATKFSRSLAIRMVDAGSCNGCELEMHAVNNSFYDIERFGIQFVASPRHADMLLVTGVVSRHMQEALKRTYACTPAPKLVVAMGDCAVNGGEFGTSYASCGGVDNVIPVDAYIKGWPPPPPPFLPRLRLTFLPKTK